MTCIKYWKKETKKKHLSLILYLAKLSFKNERDIKTFPGKGKIFASISAVQ